MKIKPFFFSSIKSASETGKIRSNNYFKQHESKPKTLKLQLKYCHIEKRKIMQYDKEFRGTKVK